MTTQTMVAPHTNFHFLQGGGACGEIIRAIDWASTSMGAPELWAPEIKSAVRAMLDSPLAINLYLGDDFLHIYNDALIPTLGKTRHPFIMGKPIVETSQMWHVIEPYFNKVRQGESVHLKDSLMSLDKNGYKEDCYLDLSYIPVYDHAGRIVAVQCTTIETTQKVRTVQALQQSKTEFENLIMQSSFAIATYRGKELIAETVNDAYLPIVGKTREAFIGKPLFESLPEIKEAVGAIIAEVMETGVPFQVDEFGITMNKFGKDVFGYYSFIYQATRNLDGNIDGFMATAVDVTEHVLRRRQIEESEKKLRTIMTAAPVGIAMYVGPDMVIQNPNQTFIDILGKGPHVEGKPLREALPELLTPENRLILDILDDVYATGIPFHTTEAPAKIRRDGILTLNYFNYTYTPIFDDAGKTYALVVIATDVTEQKMARQKVEDSEAHLQLLRDTVPAMIFYLDEEQRYQSYNVVFMEWFNITKETSVIGKTVREFLGEDAYKNTAPKLDRAYSGEQVRYELYAPARMDEERWLDIVYTPHVNNEGKVVGIIVHATDITKIKQTEIFLRQSETRFRSLIEEAPVATALLTGREFKISLANEMMINLWGKGNSIIGMQLEEALPELKGQPFLDILDRVFTTGKAYSETAARAQLVVNGELRIFYFNYTYKPLFNEAGEVYGIIDMALDVTEQTLSRQKIEAQEKELRDLISASPIGICVVSGSPLRAEDVNDRFLLISGKTREEYANSPYWEVLHEAAPFFEKVLDEVIQSGIKYTTEEHEMILLRNGVPETIFLTFEYIPVLDANNKVTKVIVMAVEVTHQVELRKQIEEAVGIRTKELAELNLNLKRSNSELEQFAYIASHDLQEPVRKISTFTQMLENSLGDLSDKSKNYLSKIYSSTDRMEKLIRDVLAFSQISQTNDTFKAVDLLKKFRTIESDFEVLIEQTQATLHIDNLPVIEAIPSQMIQLFSNLLSNSLKYRRKDIKPVVTVTSSIAKPEKIALHPQLDQDKKYHHIVFSDNGIGFSQEHADRIFKIFQRLHGKTDYEGTGIGLSICRKIVHTHHGHISATTNEQGGAVFNILLPA